MKTAIQRILTALAGAVGEKRCPLCTSVLPPEALQNGLCDACLRKLTEEASLPCPGCGNSIAKCTCLGTALSPLHIFIGERTWLAHTWYCPDTPDRITETLLLSCKRKYNHTLSRYIAQGMAADLAPLLPKEKRKGWILTYAPRSTGGYARHGFDQCEEIVRQMGRILDIPVRQVLVRTGGAEQKSMETAGQREDNIADAFEAVRVPKGCRVLLFDDIITTGATMRAAGHALAHAGAAAVFPVAFAKTMHPKWRKKESTK